ncbi:MAG: threonine--tRNA ligase [Puniceicoccales bacterium]|jgi:threonyl-tRNA synthetase|nr:threonine--tRNA ligase [Puniceicoccales bacterium]
MDNSTDLQVMRHSAAHLLAAATLELFPGAKMDIGPATENGFYYDFDCDHAFSMEDLQCIEKIMQRMIAQDLPMERNEVDREEASSLFAAIGQIYKLDRLADIPAGETVSLYALGDFVDLCRGPHVPSTGNIGAIKLLHVAGAYYRGNEKNKQLQRIYGTAFFSKQDLQRHLDGIEEAKKRDHRKLGRELKLFTIDEEFGSGLILWLPRGTTIRMELQNFIAGELGKQGYEQVVTPHIAKLDLFRTSGHFPYYQESQFNPMLDRENLPTDMSISNISDALRDGSLDGFLLKPMNCPGHIKIFSSSPKSYRDLPFRIAEFGTVYRWEKSGELSGMTRVRGFTQDDAHIFCTEEQLESEIRSCIALVQKIFQTLGMGEYRVRLGLRDCNSDKYIGGADAWRKAEDALRRAVRILGVPHGEEVGEAAFYGPKIDFVTKDILGREWQLGTVQVDYNLPERFDLVYAGSDNQPHRPVMIHRAPFGSLERFCGVLIEHFGGDFPLWLAPEQVRILCISDELLIYGEDVRRALLAEKIRATIDTHSDKLAAKIRRMESEKIPYSIIIGNREMEGRSVTLRSRLRNTKEESMPMAACVELLRDEIATRALPQNFRFNDTSPSNGQ